MEELLSRFSITDIILFIVLIAAAFKGVVDFYDWASGKVRNKFSKEQEQKDMHETLEEKIDSEDARIDELEENQKVIIDALQTMSLNIQMLIDSDKDDIKSFITREHHYFCYQVGWIDDYSMECIERRYEHYKAENGNSYIGRFMNDLRALPKQPTEGTGLALISRDR